MCLGARQKCPVGHNSASTKHSELDHCPCTKMTMRPFLRQVQTNFCDQIVR